MVNQSFNCLKICFNNWGLTPKETLFLKLSEIEHGIYGKTN